MVNMLYIVNMANSGQSWSRVIDHGQQWLIWLMMVDGW
jgi:hypothetical protein